MKYSAQVSLRLSWNQGFTVQMLGPPENGWDVWASALWKYGGVNLGSLSSGNEGIDPLKNTGVCLAHFMGRRATNKYFRSFSGYQWLTLLEMTCLWVSLVKGSWFGFHMRNAAGRKRWKASSGLWVVQRCPNPDCWAHVHAHLTLQPSCTSPGMQSTWREAWCTQGCWTGRVSVSGCVSPALSAAPQRNRRES